MLRTPEAAIISEQAGRIHRKLLACSLSVMVAAVMVAAVIVALVFSGEDPAWPFGIVLIVVLLVEGNNIRRWHAFRRGSDPVVVCTELLKTSLWWVAISAVLWGVAIYGIFSFDRVAPSLIWFCTCFGLMILWPPIMLLAWRFNRLIIMTEQLHAANLELVEQLTLQTERAELATLARSRVLAAASHDLRQPMHALNLYLGALSTYALPDQARLPLANARLCTATMDEMIRSLLDISNNHADPLDGTRSLAGLLVVVVDDEPTMLDAVTALLKQWGCTVVAAESGADALMQSSTLTRVPDAIVCDCHLRSGEDGMAVVAALRKEFNHTIPALFVSGDTGAAQVRALVDSGLPVLRKPLSGETLQAALRQAVAPPRSDPVFTQ